MHLEEEKEKEKEENLLRYVTLANLNSTTAVAINSAASLVPEEESRAAIN